MNSQIHSEKQRLDLIFSKIKDVDELEMKSHWAKYLCVLTSGFIENVIRHSLQEYITNNSSPNIIKYLGNKISGFTNFKCSKIAELLQAFSDEWRDQFQIEVIDDEELKDAIDSVIANRHLIAHGRNVGITYVTIKNYYECVIRAMSKTYDIINK